MAPVTPTSARRRSPRECSLTCDVTMWSSAHIAATGTPWPKGVTPRQLFAELFGRATGCSQGRGGSMHLFAPEFGLMGTSGIVGPCILQAAGAGYSFKLTKTDRVAVALLRRRRGQQRSVSRGMNMAGIWKLPVVFVCENNQFATEVPFSYASANPDVAGRGATYGMPGVEVDGNDVLAVHGAAAEAVQRARNGAGPTLLECRTYRTTAARRRHGRLHVPHAGGGRVLERKVPDSLLSWLARGRGSWCSRPSWRRWSPRLRASSKMPSDSPRIRPGRRRHRPRRFVYAESPGPEPARR